MDFIELWKNGPRFAQAKHFRLGTDCVLLADFVNTSCVEKGIDLGCASGAITVLLLAKADRLNMTGLEIVPEAADIARQNMAENGFENRSAIITGDIRQHRQLFRTGEFDLVAANPPYFPLGSGKLSPNAEKATARGEVSCTLDDIVTAAAYLLHTGGCFALVHKPERLAEVFCSMSAHGIEPKRLRAVCHSEGSAPNLVLIEGKRGAKPGLKIEPLLVLHNADGTDSEEAKRIYHLD